MRTLLALIALTIAFTAPSTAQVALFAHGGYDFEAPNPLVGGGLEIGLPLDLPVELAIRPSAEFVFPAAFEMNGRPFNKEVLQANLDVIGAFGQGSVQPYLGAGVAFESVELDTSDDDAVEGDLDSSSKTVGANLLAGATMNPTGTLQPFAQVRVTLASRTAASAMVGVRVRF